MRRRWGRPFAIRWKLPQPVRSRGFRAGARRRGTSAFSASFSRSKRWRGRRRGRAGSSYASPGSSAQGWVTRPRRRMKRSTFWLLMLLVCLLVTIQSLALLDKHLRVPLMFLAKVKVMQSATEAVNQAMLDNLAQGADAAKMIQWKTNDAGKITGFLIDYKEQMRITSETIRVVDSVLKDQEALKEKIPIGHALNSPLLSSLGPSVSVRLHPASAVQAEVRTRQTSAGINMLQVEIYVHIATQIAIVIPFDQEPSLLETDIPLSYMMVVGDVPTYYYDGRGNPVGSGAAQAPALALPDASATTSATTSAPAEAEQQP
ncbi:sporulation protein YunB [Cohnella fermenti]|uniref:Sporulation protein YunB n=1 Tax=Cohnella fermenti TaxID=2565925 RepID=A0A4S4C5X0_9BACL|nr:sporulation protein YunB [Cohnella fermenti]THF82643.1 sporulation protein YunB [Cohnella fermenti]